jgi:ATP phosphoribosyltransferase regulatory subunit HisZ
MIEAQSISTLIATFSAFGYQRIKPPLLEFEEQPAGAGAGRTADGARPSA